MINNQVILDEFNSPLRQVYGRVSASNGAIFTHLDALKSLKIERTGEDGKFFGFGVCQKLSCNLINVTEEGAAGAFWQVELGAGGELVNPFPRFYANEIKRDEKTNELSITAYDVLYTATEHTVGEVGLEAPYYLTDAIGHIAEFLDLDGGLVFKYFEPNDLYYEEGANLEGTESLREVLNAFAEVTQSIYYVSAANELVFVRLGNSDEDPYHIDKTQYFELNTKQMRGLGAITHATELGDNYTAEVGTFMELETQIVRDNPFWELRADVPELVEEAKSNICGLHIGEFDCSWRGNFLLEIGDFISFEVQDSELLFHSFLLNDTIEYSGGLSQKTSWTYAPSEGVTATNPTNLGEVLKQTFAKVDKTNKQIDLVVSEVGSYGEEINNLRVDMDGISGTVTRIEEDGVNKVTTETGFVFDEQGLTISKSDSTITTTITEDGMTIKNSDEPVLKVDNNGVDAKNLHATTYLFVGKNSRFQDYNNYTRTGCFWIGE